MEFRVLGPLEVLERGDRVPLGGPKQRLVLAALLVHANRLVPADSLIDDIWGDEPPDAARSALQAYISRLRKILGPDRLEGRPPGYVLHAEPEEVDAALFERLVHDARERLGADPKTSADLLDRALLLWRGTPLADLGDSTALRPEAARLEELHVGALEDRMEASLALGRPADAAQLERLVVEHPLRERFWGQLMLTLYRAGRQADALDAYRRARSVLSDELGIDPSPELQKLHERILRQDPGLSPPGEPLRSYRLLERVGDGPFGVVHRAVQPPLGREVAVKAVHRRYADDPSFIRRFEFDAQVVARLEHPAIVPLYDYWRDPDGAYLVMRYLRGGDLRTVLRDGSLEAEERLRVLERVAEALDAAHAAGVVHGDVKLENVLFDESGNAYLADFGIATGPEATRASDIENLVGIAGELLAEARGMERRYESGTALVAALRQAIGADPFLVPAPAVSRNPYKGLRPFLESDAGDFFGRELVTEQLVAALSDADARFLAVVGPSGCGKSSLVRAGLIPAIRGGAIHGSDRWFVVEMVPGARPFEELEEALVRIAVAPPPNLLDDLERDGIDAAVRRVLPSDDSELLLVVDQFEELFTLVRDESTRSAFLAALAACAMDPRSRTRVVVTLRADFYDRPLQYTDFADLLATRTVVITPPSTDELERAVSGPAEGVGVRLEPQIVAQVLADVSDQPGALPLLQYALTELFDQRTDSVLTVDAYHRIGGVSGAIARRAESLFEAQGSEGREAARQLFLRLITVGEEGAEDTRRRVLRTELTSLELDAEAMNAVIDAYGARRLLSFDHDPVTRGPTVEVAHEALLREWTRLRGWIDGAREDVRMHRRLDTAADEWVRSGEEQSFLLRGGRLAQFEAWAQTTDVALTALERRYLDSATAQREAESELERARAAREATLERRSLTRLRAMIAILTVAALVASALSFVALGQRSRAQQATRVATARELAAAADANLDADPQRSVLLALQAVAETKQDGTVLPEATQALHAAVAADREILTLRDPSTANVDWSPDGRLLVTGGTAGGVAQHDVVIWNAVTGAKLHTLRGHTADVSFVAFSPDSSRVASVAEDEQAIVWDARSGERLHTFSYPNEAMQGVSFSPEGRRLVVTTDRTTRVVDIGKGRVQRDLGIPACGTAVFSPDGTHIAVSNGDIFVLDANSGQEVLTASVKDGACGVVYNADGSRMLSGGSQGRVSILDARTGDRELIVKAQPVVFGLDWSPDGTRIATGSPDGTAIVWDVRTSPPRQELVLKGHAGSVALLAFSPDGTRLLTGGGDGTARVWDITPAGTAEAFGAYQPNGFRGVAYSPDGSSILTTGYQQGTWGGWLWDPSTGRRVRAFPNGMDRALFGRDGSTVAIRTAEGLAIMRASSGQVVRTLSPPDQGFTDGLAFSTDGTAVAAGVWPFKVEVWDARSGEMRALVGGETGGVKASTRDVALSPDGKLVASMDSRAVLRVWNVASERQLLRVNAHSGRGSGVAFSPDGTTIATSGEDGAALWAVPSWRLLHRLSATGEMHRVAFSGDGRLLATAGGDGIARVWDVDSGRLDVTLTGHAGELTGLAFSPDGMKLAVTGEDGMFRLYILPVGQLEGIARSRLTRSLTPAECLQYLHTATCPPSPVPSASGTTGHPSAPEAIGPEGAFHVSIAETDLRGRGIPGSRIPLVAGDYVIAFSQGRWFIHETPLHEGPWEASGPYSVEGQRVTLRIVDDIRCFGGTMSADWSLSSTSLTFSRISTSVPEACSPADDFDSTWTAVLGSHALTRLF
jgi:WD40 repeat protein/DNA-binding SARP family transcriptional activator/energy-coupling factor transporter ATP-binding protein EcfA2